MRRVVRAVWSLTWLGALLVGLPVVLIRYVGWNWPHGQEWRQWVMDPMIRPVLIDVVAIIMWLLWGLLLYGLTVEISTRMRRLARGSRLRLPPLPTPMQATASGLIGATVLSTATSTAAAPPVLASSPAPATATMTGTASASAAQVAPAVADSAAAGPPTGAQHTGEPGTVAPPGGGWISHHTALAVDAAAALVWRQRRRRYIPQPPSGPVRHDPDLAPLPGTVTTIQHQLHPLPDDDDQAGEDSRAPHVGPVVEAIEKPLQLSDLPPGGLGLVGPGAADAARGLLIAMLLTGQHPDEQPRVIITSQVLATLLGAHPTDERRDTLGLQVTATLTDAIAAAEQVALHRSPLPDPTSPPTSRREAAADRPPVLVICEAPSDAPTARRLAVLLTLATHLGITGVLLDSWPQGSTWHVNPDGAAHPTNTDHDGGARFSVLGATATGDLVTLHQQAHPTQQPPTTDHSPGHADPSDTATARATPPPVKTTGPTVGMPPTHSKAHLRLQVLGPSAVYPTGGTTPLRLHHTAALPILVFLALHPDGATTSELSTALWPQLHPSATASRFYTTMFRLRATLGPLTGGPTIVRDTDGYHLDPDHIEVDLWRLHAAVQNATIALNSTDRAHHLQHVIDAYTGELAYGRPWPWLAPHREAVRRHVIDAYVTLATHHTDPQAALDLLRAAARIDPDNDNLRQRLASQQDHTNSP